MFAYETQILQQLALLVVCHDLAVGQAISHYFLVQRPMSWFKAREYCQKHYVDLAVLSTEEQYFTLLSATAASKMSFWLGLQRQSVSSGWKWVDGEELSYEDWYKINYAGRCASLEAMLKKDKKLLARYCEELHMFVCQGPVSPQPVRVDSVGSDQVTLSWNVSAFMQTTPHYYNVTTCTDTCESLLVRYTNGSGFMNISISNLTSATEYFIEILAFVVRPDSATDGNVTLQSHPTTLQVKTVESIERQHKTIIIILKLLKFISLAPPLWVFYQILRKGDLKESDHDVLNVELSTEETIVDLMPEKNQSSWVEKEKTETRLIGVEVTEY